MKAAITCLVFVTILATVSFEARAQALSETTGNPAEVKFYYEDLKNFLQTMDKLKHSSDSVGIIQENYIDKASAGLKEFIRENGVDAEDYVKVMRKRPDHYESLIGMPEFLASHEEDVRAGLTKLQAKIPEAVFLPIYYLVGFYSGLHAEPSPYGLLLAFGSPGKEPESVVNTVVHETVHVQQAMAVGLEEYHSIYDTKRSLLAFAIREGVATFLTQLITGRKNKHEPFEYYVEHEKELIEKFKKEMNDSSAGDWMWAKPKNPEQPHQVGYVLGSMIVKAYYERTADKDQAVKDILSIVDYADFYEKSGFGK